MSSESKFRVELYKESTEFLKRVDDKIRRKIVENMHKEIDRSEFTSLDTILDETFGAQGTDHRTEYDMDIELWMVGQKIKEIREAKKITQEDLGKLIGVQKAQISKIENGKNLTVATIIKVFKALDLRAKIHIEDIELSLA